MEVTAAVFFSINRLFPLNPELNPICHLLALLGAHHILHFSRIRVKDEDESQTYRRHIPVHYNFHIYRPEKSNIPEDVSSIFHRNISTFLTHYSVRVGHVPATTPQLYLVYSCVTDSDLDLRSIDG